MQITEVTLFISIRMSELNTHKYLRERSELVIYYRKKHFAIKCKNKSCRDALPPKNTSPKTNETSDIHTAMHVQTTHTSQRNAFTT